MSSLCVGHPDTKRLVSLTLPHASTRMAPAPRGPQTGGPTTATPHPSRPRCLFGSEPPSLPSPPQSPSPCGPGLFFAGLQCVHFPRARPQTLRQQGDVTPSCLTLRARALGHAERQVPHTLRSPLRTYVQAAHSPPRPLSHSHTPSHTHPHAHMLTFTPRPSHTCSHAHLTLTLTCTCSHTLRLTHTLI